MKQNFTKIMSFKKAVMIAGVGIIASLGNVSMAQTYCTPTSTYGCGSGDDIKDFILNGANGTMINNLNTPCPASSHENYTTSTAANLTCTLIQSMTYTGSINSNYSCCEDVRAWIDYNQNGTFEASEQLFTPLIGIGGSTVGNFSITIPLTALTGDTRMRVRLVYYGGATIDPCASVSFGESHDYKVTIMPLAPPNNAGVGSLVTPSPTPFCSNSMQDISVSVVNLGNNALNNANVNWSVNGVMQPPVTMNTVLPNYKDSTTLLLGSVLFPTTAPLQIKAWTEMPNGVADTDNSDDTLNTSAAAVLQGVEVIMNQGDTTICQGGSIVLDAGTYPLNPIYVWSNGQLTQSINVSTPAVYSVFVQNNIGCFDEATVNVSVHPNPVANSIAITDLGDGSFQFGILGGYNIDSYDWDFGDGNIEEDAGQSTSHLYATSGEYTVTVTMSNQCGEVTIVRVLAVSVGGTGLNDLKGLAKDLKMYPNPGRDKVTITHNGSIKMTHIEMFSLMGQKVYSEDVNAEKQEINLSNLASGIYNVVIDTDKGKATKKLEVIR